MAFSFKKEEYYEECFYLFLGLISFSYSCNNKTSSIKQIEGQDSSKIETFTFLNNGTETKGKIYLPASYATNKNLPAIYLIDFTEQHFNIATDEFERVIDGAQQIVGFDALVVSLENIPDIDAEPEIYYDHYQLFKNMAIYVDRNYTKNTTRTFIGKGSESGIVLMTLFLEESKTSLFDNFIATDPSSLYASAIIRMIENNDFPKQKQTRNYIFYFQQVTIHKNAIH